MNAEMSSSQFSRALIGAAVLAAATLVSPILRAQSMSVKSSTGVVKVQHPGVPGNPTALEMIIVSLMNKPKPLDANTVLADGDGVRGDSDQSALQLECADGATQTLTGAFDAIVNMGANGQQCAITLRAGSVLATTSPNDDAERSIPTRIVAGDVTLGASSTQFGASIVSGVGTANPQAEAFVMDGSITVQRAASTDPQALTSGQRLAVGASQAEPIQEATYQRFASTYANLEVMSLPVQQRVQVQSELQSAYLSALKRPTDVEAQRQLVQVYQTRGVSASPVLNYRQSHINRLQIMNNAQPATQPATGAAKAATQVMVPAAVQPQ